MRHPSEGWRINGQYDETNDPTEAAAGLSGGNRESQSLLFPVHVGFQGATKMSPYQMTHGLWATSRWWLSISQAWRTTQSRPRPKSLGN